MKCFLTGRGGRRAELHEVEAGRRVKVRTATRPVACEMFTLGWVMCTQSPPHRHWGSRHLSTCFCVRACMCVCFLCLFGMCLCFCCRVCHSLSKQTALPQNFMERTIFDTSIVEYLEDNFIPLFCLYEERSSSKETVVDGGSLTSAVCVGCFCLHILQPSFYGHFQEITKLACMSACRAFPHIK